MKGGFPAACGSDQGCYERLCNDCDDEDLRHGSFPFPVHLVLICGAVEGSCKGLRGKTFLPGLDRFLINGRIMKLMKVGFPTRNRTCSSLLLAHNDANRVLAQITLEVSGPLCYAIREKPESPCTSRTARAAEDSRDKA